ncbi:MAG: hypothetical protein JSR77_15820 [Planctomycetes bacterium]|nr:hypothetical protein [Planctomycetota bacterium]
MPRLLAISFLAGALMGGCNIVAPAVVLLHGPERTKAEYTLDEKRPTVVFVDDRANRLSRRSLRLTIAKTAQDLLLKEGDLKVIIDAKAPLTRVSGETADQPMDMATLGREVSAEVMIYVTVDSFTLSADGTTYEPTAVLRIKVIDCVNSPARLWPEEAEGKTITVKVPTRQGTNPKNGTEAAQGMDKLASECGRSVAELFYSHVTDRRVNDTNN